MSSDSNPVATPERWITIRGYTNIMYTIGMWPHENLDHARPLTADLIDGWMKDCAARGVTAVVWQPHCGGTCCVHPGPVLPLPEAAGRDSDDAVEDWWHALHGEFYTDLLRALHAETSRRGQRLIPCTTHDGRWGWGGSGGAAYWAYHNEGGPEPDTLPATPMQFQWQRWAKEGIADALLLSAPESGAVAEAQRVRAESGLPVLIWRKVNPGITADQLTAYAREAHAAATGELDGYAVHAMFIWLLGKTQFDHYPPMLWSLINAATPH